MGKDIPVEILNMLQTTVQKAGKRSPVTPIREANIEWIEKLPRKDLEYGRKERQILIHTTCSDEKIFIQYPGKESVRSTQNPWDFRPILYSPQNNDHHPLMSFMDITNAICDAAKALGERSKKDMLRVFAALLYRMAFMLDHTKLEIFDTEERDAISGRIDFSTAKAVKLPTIFKYAPNKQVLSYIAEECPQWGNMSFEGFIFHYELLVWNEDCKYYYRNHYIKQNGKWIGKTGRVNTLFTGIRIVGYLLGEVSLADLIYGFSQQRGVSPASNDEVVRVCGGFVE